MHTLWEEEIISSLHLDPDTVGTIMKLQNLKEETYLDYYYGDIAITILKSNLDRDYSNEELLKIVNDKSNYYKLFRNQRLQNILTDEDVLRINNDILHYIRAVLVTKSNDNKYIEEMNKLSKGDYSSLTSLHYNFKIVKKYLSISSSFAEERDKLDKHYDIRIKEIDDINDYQLMVAREWKDQIIGN